MNSSLNLHNIISVKVETHDFKDSLSEHESSTVRLIVTDASDETFTVTLFLEPSLKTLNINLAPCAIIHD
jgi:bifunctional DNase/RNase